MKKLMYLMLALVLAMGLAACGSAGNDGGGDSSEGSNSDFAWTRVGTFMDEDQNYLLISEATDEEHQNMWAVTAMLANGEVHGWFLEQKGETLYGNLNTEYDDNEGDYFVTISEEGDSGVAMAVEGGETYHFAMEESPGDYIALLQINTDGMGSVAYGHEGEDIEFDDEFPTQSAAENLKEPTTFVIKAKPDEGWKFVKWTKDGEDFSTESEITVEVSEDVEYRAVFDAE